MSTTLPPAVSASSRVFAGSAAYAAHRRASAAPGPVLSIGNFDGVHRGHRHLLAQVVEDARQRGVPAAVYTFDPPPRAVLAPSQRQPRITAWPERVRLLGELGIDHVIIERFSRAFAQHPPEWFADEVLGARIQPTAMIVGYDFRFGRARAGTVDTLRQRLAVPVRQVEALVEHGDTLSSSLVRQLLASGEVRRAAELLGRPHVVGGVVVPGDARGRTIGFPTANVETDAELLPAIGVYAVRARIDRGPWRPAVANLGVRPTFGGDGPFLVEVHVLDFSGDIYGREVEVAFVERIRGERRFDGVDALVAQIRQDVQDARRLAEGPPSGD